METYALSENFNPPGVETKMFTCGHCHKSHEIASSAYLCAVVANDIALDKSRFQAAVVEEKASVPEPVTTRTPVTEAGMYRKDGVIYKVQKAVHGSGHLYAKQLVVERDKNLWDGEGESIVRFDYAPGAIRELAAEDRMTLDEAKEFGALYGTCVRCGATLTRETSIAAGIGPDCAKQI